LQRNHKSFLSKYFIKRFIKLYKAYIGYTILAFIPLYCVIYLATFHFKLNVWGTNHFWNNLNLEGLLNIIAGDNFVDSALWYLIALIIITFVCFTILYYFSLPTLFYFSLALIIFDVIFWDNLNPGSDNVYHASLLFKVMIYMPAYIFGILFGYKKFYSNNKGLLHIFSILFAAQFLFSILFPNNILHKYDILLYGFTLPPFMFLVSTILLGNNYIKKSLFIFGSYSFQIYLLHMPVILPVSTRLVRDIFKMNYFITPYLMTIGIIIICISTYKVFKKIKLNTLFE